MEQRNLFDLESGQALKEVGMERAAKQELLELARDVAVRIARSKADYRITVDDIYLRLLEMGENPSRLGNAWGSVFQNKFWKFTGLWRASIRVSNHARQERIWELR